MISKNEKIDVKTLIRKYSLPLVGIGPMSKDCVDIIFKYSQERNRPMFLIATRRQIEASIIGEGYVNNWSTEEFSTYISALKKKYPKSAVYLCRDHGGPWQGINENNLNYKEALRRALLSFETDIISNFDILHIDPSIHPKKKLPYRLIISRMKRIMFHCHEFAKKLHKKIEFEIGTEETNGSITEMMGFKNFIKDINLFCEKNNIAKPLFVVGQTGSLVKEMRQVGDFDTSNTKKLISICNHNGVLFKEHNVDYLSEYQLSLRREVGVHAINVAPEFGVIETKCFIKQCYEENKLVLVKRFLSLSLSSRKWEKWIINEKYINSFDRSIIAGHYVFSNEKFIKLRDKLDRSKLREKIEREIYKKLNFYQNKPLFG